MRGLGIRVSNRRTIDRFANAILASDEIGSGVYRRFGLRWPG